MLGEHLSAAAVHIYLCFCYPFAYVSSGQQACMMLGYRREIECNSRAETLYDQETSKDSVIGGTSLCMPLVRLGHIVARQRCLKDPHKTGVPSAML